MNWQAYAAGSTIGQHGSENGEIIRDEELVEGARISLERNGTIAPYAVTCGIYGWMAHTRFFGSDREAEEQVDRMKTAIEGIVKAIPYSGDPDVEVKRARLVTLIEEFVEAFP